jgi:DNA-binding transcriptional regulator YiaG
MVRSNKYRVTTISDNGSRKVEHLTEQELQKLRAKRLQKIRKEELGLTQKSLAKAVGVKLRTLQDWEIGRSKMPRPVEILMEIMRDHPDVRDKLLNSKAD